MILTPISYKNLIKTLYLSLSSLSELPLGRVLNIDSVRGIDLNKLITSTESTSINMSDSIILFELLENNNDENFVTTEEDNSLSYISSYQFVLHFYGNYSHELSKKVASRYKSIEVISDLREIGIYYNGIEPITNVKEFINNSLWQRCDCTINFIVRHSFDKVSFNTPVNETFEDEYNSSDISLVVKEI